MTLTFGIHASLNYGEKGQNNYRGDSRMRALLKPVVARELGIVLLKPGSELMPLFSCERVLVESQPAGVERLPTGHVPDVRQPLASDDSCGLSSWMKRL